MRNSVYPSIPIEFDAENVSLFVRQLSRFHASLAEAEMEFIQEKTLNILWAEAKIEELILGGISEYYKVWSTIRIIEGRFYQLIRKAGEQRKKHQGKI